MKSTIYKAELGIADIEHGYYGQHALTLARHPSETDQRMMVRLVAYALQAWTLDAICAGDGTLGFGVGLSDPDEPDVVLRDYTGRIRHWVEVGQPDERHLARACGQADRVTVYAYAAAAPIWWKGMDAALQRFSQLQVWTLNPAQADALAAMAQRSMNLQATIQDNALMLNELELTLEQWK